MEAFGDQFSSIELLEMNDRKAQINANDGKEVTQEFNETEVKQILDEIEDKCEQLVSLDRKTTQENGEIEVKEQPLRQTDSDADIDVSEQQTESKANDIVVNDKDINEKPDDTEVDQNMKESDRLVSKCANSAMTSKLKTMTEKWGQSVGVCDEKGVQRRVLDLSEINNYLKLELTSAKSDFNYYLSLINDRYPRFYDSTIDYLQRWRMRYNVFVDNVFESPKNESVLHVGEIHLYFDLIPRSPQPFYVNNSFYRNTLPSEIPVDDERIQRITKTFDSIRFGKDIFQLKFPIRSELFKNCNKLFDKFMERQTEFVEEAQSVHRKNEQKRKFWNSSRRGRFQSTEGFRGYTRSNRNEKELAQNNRDFGRNERGFRRNNRGFDGKRRGFGRNRNAKDNSVDNGLDCEITFEDTRERRESDANKLTTNRGRRFKRSNHKKGMDDRMGLRSGPSFVNSERDRYRSDSTGPQYDENRRRNRGSFRGRDKERLSTTFGNERNDLNYNRIKQASNESAPETNSHSNSGNNFKSTNRRSSFGHLELK